MYDGMYFTSYMLYAVVMTNYDTMIYGDIIQLSTYLCFFSLIISTYIDTAMLFQIKNQTDTLKQINLALSHQHQEKMKLKDPLYNWQNYYSIDPYWYVGSYLQTGTPRDSSPPLTSSPTMSPSYVP